MVLVFYILRSDIAIIFSRFFFLTKRGITQYALIHKYGVSPSQITHLKRNESVSTHTIDVFCGILRCRVEEIMEHIEEK